MGLGNDPDGNGRHDGGKNGGLIMRFVRTSFAGLFHERLSCLYLHI